MMKKKVIVIAMIAAIAVSSFAVLTACSGANEPSPAPTVSGTKENNTATDAQQ